VPAKAQAASFDEDEVLSSATSVTSENLYPFADDVSPDGGLFDARLGRA
jgi:hypothetical protein